MRQRTLHLLRLKKKIRRQVKKMKNSLLFFKEFMHWLFFILFISQSIFIIGVFFKEGASAQLIPFSFVDILLLFAWIFFWLENKREEEKNSGGLKLPSS